MGLINFKIYRIQKVEMNSCKVYVKERTNVRGRGKDKT